MTVRKSATDDARDRRLYAWAAIAVAFVLAAGTALVARYVFANPYPPAGISDGVNQ